MQEQEFAALQRFVNEVVRPGDAEWDKAHAFPLDAFQQFHALGWLSSFVPEALGGTALSTQDLCRVSRALASGSSGFTTSFIATVLAAVPVIEFGSAELQARSVGRLSQNFALWSFCFTEPGAGSDVFRIQTRARRVPGGYELSGQKCFITNANFAEHFVVIAFLEGESNPRKASIALYVPRNAPGLSFGKPWDKLGHRASNTTDLFMERVFVPEGDRLGAEGDGFRVAFHSLQRSRLFFAAGAVGLCDHAGQLVLDDLKQRQRYGKPLLDNPVIQDRLADLYTQKEASWQLTQYAASLWDQGAESLKESSMAKLFAGNLVVNFVSQCMELLGGWGYAEDSTLARLHRDALLFEVIEGASFVQKAIIAKELFRPIAKR